MANIHRLIFFLLVSLLSFASFAQGADCKPNRPANVPADGTKVYGCGGATPDSQGILITVVPPVAGGQCKAGPECGASGFQAVYVWLSVPCPAGGCKPPPPPVTPDSICEKEGLLWNSTLNPDRSGRVPGKASEIVPNPQNSDAVVCFARPEAASGGPAGCKHFFEPELSFQAGNKPTDPWFSNGFSAAITNKDNPRAQGTLACDPNSPDPVIGKPELKKQPEDCKNGYKGQVNGIDVCIEAWTGQTEGVDWSKTTDAAGDTVTKKTTLKCEGDNCKATEETRKNGGTGPPTTSTYNVARSKYCEEKPKSSVCNRKEDKSGTTKGQDNDGSGGAGGKGEEEDSQFGGACEGGFTCTGDAIQCSIAKEQHIRACTLFETETPESLLYEENKGKEGNQTEDLEGNDTVDLNNKIDQTDILGGGAGVSDLTVVVAGSTVVLPFSLLNTSLGYLGQLLVAVSMLVAFRIVGRG